MVHAWLTSIVSFLSLLVSIHFYEVRKLPYDTALSFFEIEKLQFSCR